MPKEIIIHEQLSFSVWLTRKNMNEMIENNFICLSYKKSWVESFFVCLFFFFIIPIIIQSEYIVIVRIGGKVGKVVVTLNFILSPFKLSFHGWAKNMNEKYDLFSPQIFISIFLMFISLTNQTTNSEEFFFYVWYHFLKLAFIFRFQFLFSVSNF